MTRDGWLTATEAAARLGVKPATLYAYVSRGLVRRERAADGRTSRFDPADVERLAAQGRRAQPVTPLLVRSAITTFVEGRYVYRGRDAITLARATTFERLAEWLWTGALPDQAGWIAPPALLPAGTGARAALPPYTLPLDRLKVIVPALATADDLRFDTGATAVVVTARGLLAALVECLPPAGPVEPGAHSFAARLWSRLCTRAATADDLRLLDLALGLLADHELSASTLAARLAASMRADPYAVVSTGLGVVSGALHGAASLAAEAFIDSIPHPTAAARVVGEWLRRGEPLPGFGHPLYPEGDPRATALIEALRPALADAPALAVAEAVLAAVQGRGLPPANVDFALAAFVRAAGMVHGAGEAIFAVARTAGWIAHALEEYAERTVLRARAVYTGPVRSPESRV